MWHDQRHAAGPFRPVTHFTPWLVNYRSLLRWTEPMYIRPFHCTDIPELLTWFPTPAALAQWGSPARQFPLDEPQVAALLAETGGLRPARRIWAAEQDGVLVATTSVVMNWQQGVALLAMVGVAPSARGTGLAKPFLTEIIGMVFSDPAFARLELNVYTFNAAAIRTYERLGFVSEGVRRSAAKVEGERWDVAHYSLLRTEYVPLPGRGLRS